MNIKPIVFFVSILSSNIVQGSIIDNDTYTTDSSTNLDWLDLTATQSLSYNSVKSQMGAGGRFSGWRYATAAEVSSFFDAFGGNGDYNGYSLQNNGLFDSIAPLWGDLFARPEKGEVPGDGWSHFITADAEPGSTNSHNYGYIYDGKTHPQMGRGDLVYTKHIYRNDNYSTQGQFSVRDSGSALVRASASPVPIPPSIALMGTGLLGLVRLKYKKPRSFQ